MIADVGLVGFPNVGKSTFLSRVTNAKPKIANYHFTTLNPNLGVVDLGEKQGFVMVVEKLYHSVKTGNEAQISIDSNSKPDYREKLEVELKALRESEMWQTAVTVRKLRPENN